MKRFNHCREIARRFKEYGLRIYDILNPSVHNIEEVTLNLPGRDVKIEEICAFIRSLDRAGTVKDFPEVW